MKVTPLSNLPTGSVKKIPEPQSPTTDPVKPENTKKTVRKVIKIKKEQIEPAWKDQM